MVAARVIGGIVGGSIAAFVISSKDSRKEKVYASWTTNSSPSVRWDYNWDRRDPACCARPPKSDGPDEQNRYNEDLQKAKSKATRHIFLIRHSQYNQSGESDQYLTLTELGRKQADYTGQRLQHLGHPFSKIIHSTMTRAVETATIIHKHFESLPMEACELIREGAPVPPEPPIGYWKPESTFYTDGARIEAGFRKYFHRAPAEQAQDSYEIIVCHANVIRYWLCRVLQLPPEAWLRFSVANASITKVCLLPSGRVTVRSVGDTGHLPKELITRS
ncbi:serine/threonine-protein phosphatase Pgam5, mitochondrial-like [Ornithodoros turicata]|uniref:serine/threonine-protein phosphatase Pgam5, mitochondrial-like n=1 Tax=Ornithodoros turicata TaxID=34597 RepID=UPI003139DD38